MRLLFVDNLLLPEKGDTSEMDVHPHLGLISLVAVAERGGHEASILDPKWQIASGRLRHDETLYRRAAEMILQEQPEAVGFTTLGCSFIFTLKVARHLKRRQPDLPILLGGPHSTILHEKILRRFQEFDVVVRHEAEENLLPVLEGLPARRFEGIPGVTWRSSSGVVANPGTPSVADLDSLPFPAFERYPVEELGLEYLRVDAGRGCPFNCTFCSTASFFGRSYRLKSPPRLVEELDRLHARYGVTDFKLNHDLFTVNRKKVLAFCEAVRGRGYTWGVSARVDCVDRQLLEAMWEAGCRGIYFGIETGSRRMQKVSEKRLDLDLVSPILDVTEELGMRTIVSFICGYPQETAEDQDATLDVLGDCFRRNRTLFTTQLHMLTPEPGTQLYEEFGDRLEYDGYLTDFNACKLEEDDEEIIRAHPDIFVTYYYYPVELPRERAVFAVEAYRVLRKAGHSILRYAIGHFGGRFSRLVGRWREWTADLRGGEKPVSVRTALEFLADELGHSHHLTSLFRYSLATVDSRKLKPGRGNGEAAFDEEGRFRLSRGTYLFRDIHNCSALLERIRGVNREGGLLDDSEAGQRGHYLVIGKGTKDGALENYELTPESYAIVSLFEQPRSYGEIRRMLDPYLGSESLDSGFFQELVEIGALTPVPA